MKWKARRNINEVNLSSSTEERVLPPASMPIAKQSNDSLSSMDSFLNNDHRPAKCDMETQTDSETAVERSRRDSSCQTMPRMFTMETQTVDIESIAHVGRNFMRQEIVLEIPEKLLEKISSTPPTKKTQPVTELSTIKLGEIFKFNFLGAFLDFQSMDTEEILKIQAMLESERFDVCQRAVYARKPYVPKFILSV